MNKNEFEYCRDARDSHGDSNDEKSKIAAVRDEQRAEERERAIGEQRGERNATRTKSGHEPAGQSCRYQVGNEEGGEKLRLLERRPR